MPAGETPRLDELVLVSLLPRSDERCREVEVDRDLRDIVIIALAKLAASKRKGANEDTVVFLDTEATTRVKWVDQ